MDFAINIEARKWFGEIKNDLTAPQGTQSAPDFDAFYFCFIAGMTEMRKKDVPPAQTAQLVENFPGPYQRRGRLLLALFLSHELKYRDVPMDKKIDINDTISKLVDTDAPNFLSDEGVREFNKFAHGGYEVLLEWFDDDKPRTLEIFLRTFHRKIESARNSSGGAG